MVYLVEDDSSIRELVVYTLNSTGIQAEGFEKPSYRPPLFQNNPLL